MELVVKSYKELTIDELYEILKVRCAVFVVEQNCPYLDVDEKDKRAMHVWLKDEQGIQAYCRVLERGVTFEDVCIGRVISLKRRCGLGTELLKAGIRVAKEVYSAEKIVIEAQLYAKPFYELQGFVQSSDVFLEDGIEHIQMILECK